ncbi:iron export ABC transporter permease subunit FetB [Terasakiella sp. A23]|uniref:ABC transporter permease n=1 Tax=Terasakiella sp. FCG-A23 TaxID=3080561 RepID=UPI002955AEAF|nr:iron export ABC transporter permease subunit FetB [Terasakiella sp. A23]MDV7340632.1 iron export ABC transporter permease subunit FetB [Terasakiella sp. A23]
MISIGYQELALGSLLLLVHGAVSFRYKTGTTLTLFIAGIRMVVQLGLMAYVLQFLFRTQMPLWTLLAFVVMICFAGYEVVARQKRPIHGWWGYGIGTGSMFMAASLVTVFALYVQVKPDPWYEARYSIPLLGMVLGNTMTGISIGLTTLTTSLKQERDGIEARLALGHTRYQACETVVRQSLHTGLIGIVNSMSAAGLVFIPGMMTGQVMAGADPFEAAKYQALVMFLIAGGTAMGTTLAILLGVYRLTDDRHRLRLERLKVRM